MPGDNTAPSELTALILAAGEGLRFGHRPKAFVAYQDSTLLARAIAKVSPWVNQIVVGVREKDLARAQDEIAKLPEAARVRCIAGGATRQETVARALECAFTRFVLLHEVARPWTQEMDFQNIVTALRDHPAVILYTRLAERDSVALMHGPRLGQVLPRNQLISLQTPHAYERALLEAAHTTARCEGWTEAGTAALVQRAGFPVHLVESVGQSSKVTYPGDLVRSRHPFGPA